MMPGLEQPESPAPVLSQSCPSTMNRLTDGVKGDVALQEKCT